MTSPLLESLRVVGRRESCFADAAERREKQAFDVLVNRLRIRKWYAANRERKLKYMADYKNRPGVRERNAAAQRRSRAAKKAIAREAA